MQLVLSLTSPFVEAVANRLSACFHRLLRIKSEAKRFHFCQIVRNPDEETKMKVLIAIDDSAYSKHVIDTARRRHWPKDTEFRIVTVIEPISEPNEAMEDLEFTSTLEELEKRRKQAALTLCQRNAEKLSAIPSALVHFDIRQGRAATEILKSALEWPASKILIGAHGRGLCPHGFIGSVSRAVSERAGCAVEVVKEAPKTSPQHNVPHKSTVRI